MATTQQDVPPATSASPAPRVSPIALRRLERRFAVLTMEGLRDLVAYHTEQDWQREAVEGAAPGDFTPLGIYAMRRQTPTGISSTPAYLVQIHRPKLSPTRPERTIIAALYLADDLRTLR